MLRGVLVLLFLMLTTPARATIYYISQTDGNDDYSGTGPVHTTGSAGPWRTVAKVNGTRFAAGDFILFKRDCRWRETLVPASSGDIGNAITFGAYGTGANPVLDGSAVVSGWSAVAGRANTWLAVVNTEPRVVVVQNQRGMQKASAASLTAANDWYWESNSLYLYREANPGSTVEAGKRDCAIQITSPQSYLVFQDLTLTGSNYYGFDHNVSGSSSDITVQRVTATYSGSSGIFFWQRHGTQKTSGILVSDCTVFENGADGIDISSGINDITVRNNTVHHNNWSTSRNFMAGIHVFSAGDGNNILVEHNVVYSQYNSNPDWPFSPGLGVWLDTVGPHAAVRYNHVYNNAKGGILVENTADAQISYNVVHNNGTNTTAGIRDAGIFVYRLRGGVEVLNNVVYGNPVGIALRGENAEDRGMVGHVVKNNISVGNTYQQLVATFGAENDGVMGSGNVYLNNCFGPEAASFVEWGNGVFKSTYEAWEASNGRTTHSVKADPMFVDATRLNFQLQATSPCRDAGVKVGLSADYLGAAVPQGSAPDIGAYEKSPEGPLGPRAPTGVKIIKQ